MKVESTVLVEQIEISHEEKERALRPWTFFLAFFCSSNMLVCWFYLHRVTSSVRSFSEPNPKMVLVNFRLLTSSLSVFNCLSLPRHTSRQLPQTESSPTFCLVSAGGTSVSAGPTTVLKIWDLQFVFFLVILC